MTAALGLGFVLGVRHALDADHVAAMSALVSQDRTVLRSCVLGAVWGLGHTAALMLAAVVVIAFKLTIPPPVERSLEMVVALVLVLLGGHVLLRCLAGVTVHAHPHVHGGQVHEHLHVHAAPAGGHAGLAHDHGHGGFLRLARRPFALGIVHGLAGSAALLLLAVAAIPSALAGLVYVMVFGLGSTLGMLVLSGLIGVPVALAASRSPLVHLAIQALAGSISIAVGLWLAWELI